MMDHPHVVQQRYEAALNAFVEKAQQDRHVLAVILFGSLSYDRVWEKSDIDLMVVTRDDKDLFQGDEERGAALVEGDVNLHAVMMPRSGFKKLIEGSLQSSFLHSSFAKSRLIFTHDDTIRTLYDGVHTLRSGDRQLQLLSAAAFVLPTLYKAEKWFYVRHDPHYSFVWILLCVTSLAKIESYKHYQLAGREVIQQALELNPVFFSAVYTDLIDGPKDSEAIETALKHIDQYLEDNRTLLFQPILDYLAEEGSARSATEITTYFDDHYGIEGVLTCCEWLADKQVITKVSTPMRLTSKSNVTYEEMAFYYAG